MARELAKEHAKQRPTLNAQQVERWQRETAIRQSRLHKGLRGFWDWLSGKAKAVREQNERETWHALRRDQRERDEMVLTQLEERRALSQKLEQDRHRLRHEDRMQQRWMQRGRDFER